jgi:sugar/nucleoside kinase (ribokinase family)
LELLKKRLKPLNVVVMPDFFFDRLINLEWNANTLSEKLKDVARRKGGSLDGISQTDLRGGNAVNTASALAAFGINVTPIVCTSKFGLKILKFHLERCSMDLSHVKILNKASVTTAIELRTKRGKANVMLRDVGALADFGPRDLDDDDLEAIENADYVCVFNWAGTQRYGTALARMVFQHAKLKGKGKTYYDTADPTPNDRKIPELVGSVLNGRYLDVLSVNENEAVCYAARLSDKIGRSRKRLKLEALVKESAKTLACHLSTRIDLHTTQFSATFTKDGETIVSAFRVPVLRATGAGDAWNAGNILGDAYGLSDELRLELANAVAGYYISNPDGAHGTRKELQKFLRARAKVKT